MSTRVLLLLGTKKGAFILESDALRRSWELRGPFCETWPMNHVVADAATETIYAGGGDAWFGPAVWKSADLGATWTHSSESLAYQAGEEPIKAVWSVAPAGECRPVDVHVLHPTSEAQLAFLRERGCDAAQGYLLGRPGPGEAVGRLLAETARTVRRRVM